MKLLTKEIENKLPKLYSTEGQNIAPVIVKFFTPWSNWTWYAVEGEQLEDGDWQFFGLVDGHEKELGYFNLSELADVRGPGAFRCLGIERDRYFDGMILDKENLAVRSAKNALP
jgi:hypothetical protein